MSTLKLRAAPQIPAEIERLLAVRVDGQLPDWAASEAVDQFAALSSDARRALAPWFQEQVPAKARLAQEKLAIELFFDDFRRRLDGAPNVATLVQVCLDAVPPLPTAKPWLWRDQAAQLGVEAFEAACKRQPSHTEIRKLLALLDGIHPATVSAAFPGQKERFRAAVDRLARELEDVSSMKKELLKWLLGTSAKGSLAFFKAGDRTEMFRLDRDPIDVTSIMLGAYQPNGPNDPHPYAGRPDKILAVSPSERFVLGESGRVYDLAAREDAGVQVAQIPLELVGRLIGSGPFGYTEAVADKPRFTPAMPKDKQSRGEVEALLAIAHPYAVDVDEAARVTVDASCPLAIKKSPRARNLAVDRILAGTPEDLRHRWLEDLAPNRRE